MRRTFATGVRFALITSSVVGAGATSHAKPERLAIVSARGAGPTTLRPPIRQWPIPFGPTRRREMAAYSLRHYGEAPTCCDGRK